jgi:hypothetical protein
VADFIIDTLTLPVFLAYQNNPSSNSHWFIVSATSSPSPRERVLNIINLAFPTSAKCHTLSSSPSPRERIEVRVQICKLKYIQF